MKFELDRMAEAIEGINAKLATMTVDIAILKHDNKEARQVVKWLCGIVSGIVVGLALYQIVH
jgi:hypothetical protein